MEPLRKTYYSLSCPHCSHVFSEIDHLKAHVVSKHTEQCRFFCFICNMKFYSNSTLMRHTEHLHQGPRYNCNVCQSKFKDKCSLRTHMQKHKPEGMPKHKCSNCDKTYQSIRALHHHEADCKGDNIEAKCEICLKMVDTSKLIAHLRTHEEPKYECEICHKILRKACSLRNHLSYHKKKLKQFCDICGETHVNKSAAEIHRMDVHTKEFEVFCEICDKGFYAPYQVKYHMKTVHRDPNYPIEMLRCPVEGCGKSYKSNNSLKIHLSTHEKEHAIFSCPHCPKVWHHPLSLKRHILFNHSDRKLNSCKCHICGKELSSKPSLKIHIRMHTGEKPFTCNYCKKSFKSSNLLSTHSVVHTKEYGCRVCDKRFAQYGSLKKHFLRVHPEEEWQNTAS